MNRLRCENCGPGCDALFDLTRLAIEKGSEELMPPEFTRERLTQELVSDLGSTGCTLSEEEEVSDRLNRD